MQRCSPVFIFYRRTLANRFLAKFDHDTPADHREHAVTVALALLTTALVIVIALLAAFGAGKLARLDGATYPAALTRAAAAFAATVTLAAAVAGALAAVVG